MIQSNAPGVDTGTAADYIMPHSLRVNCRLNPALFINSPWQKPTFPIIIH